MENDHFLPKHICCDCSMAQCRRLPSRYEYVNDDELCCECHDCIACSPLQGNPAGENRQWFHPVTCGFFDRKSNIHRCFECHNYCGNRKTMTESERNELLGTRQHPEISRFLENIEYRRFGTVAPLSDDEKAALTADICITVDRLYEDEAKEDNATDAMTKLLVTYGVLKPTNTDETEALTEECVGASATAGGEASTRAAYSDLVSWGIDTYGDGELSEAWITAVSSLPQDMLLEIIWRFKRGDGPMEKLLLEAGGIHSGQYTTPESVDLRDARQPCILQEPAAVAEAAVSLEPRIQIPHESLTPWDASPNETPSVNLRDVLQPCILRGRREFSEVVAGHSASAESASAVAVVPVSSDASDNEATQDSHVEQDNIIAPEEETTNDIANPGIGGCDGNNTDAELEAMNAAPDLVRIKCVKRKYYMMHRDDSRWYQYSRKEVDELAGHVVVDGTANEAGPYAWKMKDCTQRGFELRHGARKKRVVHGVLASPPSGAPSIRLDPASDRKPSPVRPNLCTFAQSHV